MHMQEPLLKVTSDLLKNDREAYRSTHTHACTKAKWMI